MTNQQKLKKLFAILDEISAYGRSIGKLSFDMECCAPEEGIQPAGEDMAVLGKQIHKLTHSRNYEKLIEELHADSEGLTAVQKKTVEHLYDDYSKSKNISAKLSFEMDKAGSKAHGQEGQRLLPFPGFSRRPDQLQPHSHRSARPEV